MQSFSPEYRVRPDSGDREYLVNGKWAKQGAWDDPEFQALVVEPWMEQERKRMVDEHQKAIAMALERSNMAKYDYDDFLRRQEELKKNQAAGIGVRKSPFTFISPRGGGQQPGQTLGSTSSRSGGQGGY